MSSIVGYLAALSEPSLQISAPTTLSYLSSQMLYVGSHAGDSQLLRIHPTPQGGLSDDTLPIPCNISTTAPASLTEDPPSPSPQDDEDVDMSAADDRNSAKRGKIVRSKDTFIEVVEHFANIAPITDAVMADTDESGQVSSSLYVQIYDPAHYFAASNCDMLWGR